MPTPLEPTLTAHLFPSLGRELVRLLRGLEPGDWGRPTVCPAWTVQDITSHLLDTAFRRLAVGRDGHLPPPPAGALSSYPSLVGFLNGLNADWVSATRRLSPRLLTDLLEWVEPRLAEHFANLDPYKDAVFAVSWAGEERSPSWFDVARELTERWLHQQQIRLAVGAPSLTDPGLSRPIFDTFLRALPHRYRAVDAPTGTRLTVEILGAEIYAYSLERNGEGWRLLAGSAPEPACILRLAEQDAWLLLTKGLSGESARERAEVRGQEGLAGPFFGMLAVMA
jgi:uncharacterized protein (TIGR03083 family)